MSARRPAAPVISAEQWRAVDAIFADAIERPPAERAGFVAAACGTDAELRAEVESLLAAHDSDADFLETPHAAAVGLDSPPLAERLQQALGAAFRLERELAGGGMSRVFVAEEVRLGRRVVVKVLPPELGGALSMERFHQETRVAASLQHPHIVPLLAAGESPDGLVYFTMPYVEGESLDRRLEREGRLAPAEVVDIVREVAGALAHAHARGVVHRDIKPANVLLSGGHALVADFGIAKALAAASAGGTGTAGADSPGAAGGLAGARALTGSGLALGTPAYMSPEQARGAEVDARSDVYSLGCTAFELLTGRRPFAGAEAATLARRLADPPPSACALCPGLPAGFDGVLARAVAPDPDDRFPGPVAFAEALAALAAPDPTASAPAGVKSGTSVSTSSDASVDAAPMPPPGAPARAGGVRGDSRRRGRPRTAIVAATVVAAALAAAAAMIGRAGRDTRDPLNATVVKASVASAPGADASTASASDPARPTVAVLPFENAGATGDAYLADGVSEELASRLTILAGLRVIAMRSTREYRNTPKSTGQIGRELGADFLLVGRVRGERRGGPAAAEVRVVAELVRVRDGTDVWAGRYAADVGDVTAVAGTIGERVAGVLAPALDAEAHAALAERPTGDFDAYTHFLRGEALRTAPEGPAGAWQGAVAEYERAVALDPRFALAYARLSQVHSRLYQRNVDRSAMRLARALAAGETAARLAPDLAEAHLALGLHHYYGRQDYVRALDAFTTALRRRPGRAELWEWYGYTLRRQGRFAEAVTSLERAVELDPRSPEATAAVAATYEMLRDYPAALRYQARARALSPTWAQLYADEALWLVAWRGDTAAARATVRAGFAHADPGQLVARLWVHAPLLLAGIPEAPAAVRAATVAAFGYDTTRYQLFHADWARTHGEPARARALADAVRRRVEPRVAAAPGDTRFRGDLARAYALLGRRDDALREAERNAALLPVSIDPVDGPNVLFDLAHVATIVGAYDVALQHLATLLAIPSDVTPSLLRADPMWAPLRADPRFRRLVSGP